MRQRAIIISAIVLSFFCGNVVFALDIDFVIIQIEKDFYDGLPADLSKYAHPPFCFDIFTGGSGITSVSVTLPNGNTTLNLEDFGDEWGTDTSYFSTINELLAEYPTGTYTFSFNEGADTVLLTNNEIEEPLGIANITFPNNDANNVPYDNLTFTWKSCVGFGESISIEVEDGLYGEEIFENYGSPIDTTSQTITGLLPARDYSLYVEIHNSVQSSSSTVGGDSFWYENRIFYTNSIVFKTLPIPGDFQKDGRVNLLDISLLAQAWLTTPVDSAWNAACDVSEPKDNTINIHDLAVTSQHWQEVNGIIFNSTSVTITNPLLGLINVGDSYSMSGYGTLAGANRSYSLTGTETVMGVDCLILKISGYGEIPTTDYFDLRIAQDIAGYIHILKVTGFVEGSQMSWQSEAVNFSPIFLPPEESLEVGEIYPLWADNYNQVIALDQTVDLMSTGAGPYTGCIQYNWNSDGDAGGIDVDENYICPGYGYVKEDWNDDGVDGFERNP